MNILCAAAILAICSHQQTDEPISKCCHHIQLVSVELCRRMSGGLHLQQTPWDYIAKQIIINYYYGIMPI